MEYVRPNSRTIQGREIVAESDRSCREKITSILETENPCRLHMSDCCLACMCDASWTESTGPGNCIPQMLSQVGSLMRVRTWHLHAFTLHEM